MRKLSKILVLVLVLMTMLAAVSGLTASATTLPEYVVLPEGMASDTYESLFGDNTVTDGTNYYATIVDALNGIHLTENRVLYCKPGANVGTMTHGHVCDDLTIYGNGAKLEAAGEQDFELDTFKQTNSQTCEGIAGDLTLKVMYLDGCGAWGQRTTANTLNIIFENCKDMNRVYISGTSGVNNITLKNCSFLGSVENRCTLYSNANGTITVEGCEFANVYAPVNLNHKVAGTQTVVVKDTSFTSCGCADYDYAAPVRVLSSVEGATSALTVSGCTFTDTKANMLGQTADVLLDYGIGETTLALSSTAANVTVELESNVGTNTTVTAEETKEFANVTYVAQIGDVKYKTLADAFAAVVDGDTVTLLEDIVIDSETYTIADGVAVTLDMNGKKLTVTDNKAANVCYELFYIYGGLTVKGNGTIELTSTSNDTSWAKYSTIFHNRGGVLTIENGTFKHLGGTCMAYVIDNSGNYYGDAITNIYGGTLDSTYTAIRNRMEQNTHGASGTAYLNVYGGTITGTTSAIWAQAASTSTTAPATGKINISGGEIGSINTARSDGAECMTTISGGTVNGFKGEVGELTVTENGTLTGTVTILTANGEEANYVVTEDGVYSTAVAKIGEKKYATFEEAVADLTSSQTLTLLADVTLSEAVTLPVGVILNGNGHTINGTITAGGDLTFEGYTTITSFSAGSNKPTITIGRGAALEMTSGRIVIGHGATFNITGSIEDAKSADVSTITPSLIAPGASFTGAGVNFNVTNAYVKFTNYCSSKNSAANGTFNINVTNSVWEQTGKLAFEAPTSEKDPTFNLTLKDSVLTTTSHLVFAVSKGEIVIDNSNVNATTANQLEIRSTMTIKNGSVVKGTDATSSNAKKPGTLIVDDATYIGTGTYSGSDLGTGTLVLKNGAKVTLGNIANTNVTIDAMSLLTATKVSDTSTTTITVDASNLIGKVKVVDLNGTSIESIVTVNGDAIAIYGDDGDVTLQKPVAKVGDVVYTDLQKALDDAAANGGTVVLVDDVILESQEFTYPNYNRLGYCGLLISDDTTVVLDLAGHTITYSDAYGDYDNCMIINIGNLTINDSVGGGKILYNSNDNEDATKTYTYLHATILNGGTLTLNDGITVENKAPADTDCTDAIENHSHFSYSYENDVNCIVNDANIISNKYYAIRQYTHYYTGYENNLVINGGTVTGIYMQHGDSWYYPDESAGRLANASLTINGGVINTLEAAEGYTCYAVRVNMYNPDNPNWKISITGGTIDDVVIRIQRGYHYENGVSGTLVPTEANGARNAEWLEANGGFITGGTFTNIGSSDDVTADISSFLADGYTLKANDNGTYGVKEAVYVAQIGDVKYESFAEALAALADGGTLTLLADIEASEVIMLTKSMTINGNEHSITSSASRIFRIAGNDLTITINDLKMVSTAVRVGVNDIRGISIDSKETTANVKLTLKKCSVDFTDASASDWSYGVNTTDSTGHTITINGGSYEGANPININGTGHTIVIDGATLTSLYGINDYYCGVCVKISSGDDTSLKVSNTTFEGDHAVSLQVANATADVDEETCTDNTKVYMVKIESNYYYSLAEALEAAQEGDTVTLLHNVEVSGEIVVGNAIAIDGNGNKITGAGNIVIDETDFAGSKTQVISADMSGFTGTITISGNNGVVYNLTDSGVEILKPVAKVGNVYYDSLQDAVDAAADGDTVVLLSDITYTGSDTVKIAGKTLTLDLNGCTITGEHVPVNIKGGANVTLKNGTIRDTVSVACAVQVYAAKATLADDLTVISDKGSAVTVYGAGDDSTVLTTSAKLIAYAENYAVLMGQGNYDGTVINVIGGEITSYNNVNAAIYHPQEGTLNISGGTLNGSTGIIMRSGSLNITGGTINATGEYNEYAYDASGWKSTGDALVIENIGGDTGYAAIGTVSISGGTFKSTNGVAVSSYASEDEEKVVGFIFGGSFSGVLSEEYCAEGYTVVSGTNENGETVSGIYEKAVVPYIKDGYWWIDGINTGIKAEGKDGEDGEDGADGKGIVSIEKTSTEGLVDTYTITYTNGDKQTFTVTNGKDGVNGINGADGSVVTIQNGNWFIDGVDTGVKAEGVKGDTGNGISSIQKTGTSEDGLVDTYTITYTNGDKQTFTVTNGKDGVNGINGADGSVVTIQNGNWFIDGVDTGVKAEGVKGDTGNGISKIEKTSTSEDGLVDTYTITYTNGETDTFTITNGKDGANGSDGKTPSFKIEEGHLYVSYDNGETWADLGVVQGAQGEAGEDGEDGESFTLGDFFSQLCDAIVGFFKFLLDWIARNLLAILK